MQINNVLFLLPYPQSTFEALLVKTVNWGDYLKELVDALLVIEVGKLLEGLLDLLPQRLCLETEMMERERGEGWRVGGDDDEARCEKHPKAKQSHYTQPVTELPSPTVTKSSAHPRTYFLHCQFS